MELSAKFTDKEIGLLCEALRIASIHSNDEKKSEEFGRLEQVIGMIPKINSVDIFGS
jgi:Asp-tRNA(Asn)/Glu-tRNA(Gln) amidotransferase C subunit